METLLSPALMVLAFGLALLAHLRAVPQELDPELPELVDHDSA